MTKGLAVPVRVNNKGGALTVDGDDYAQQVLYIGLAGHDNANAFQQNTGLGEGMIFGVTSTSEKAAILRRLRALFDVWEAERLYRLMPETIKWSKDTQKGELYLEFQYINLETNKVIDFRKHFLSGG